MQNVVIDRNGLIKVIDWDSARGGLPDANYYENIIRDRFCNYKWIDEYMKRAVKEPENTIELFFRQSIKEQDKQK